MLKIAEHDTWVTKDGTLMLADGDQAKEKAQAFVIRKPTPRAVIEALTAGT